MADNGIARVNYYDRQFLQTQDFSDEQAYHLAMHRRHNIGGHIWGILYGLEVILDKAGNLTILPGVAIDGYGRELALPYPQGINPKAFDDQGSERLEAWLTYARQDSAEGQENWLKCSGPAQLTRAEDLAQVLLLPPDPNLVFDNNVDLPPRRQPPEVPTGDVRFDPTRVPPDDPVRSWRVYLGMIRRQKGKDPLYVVSLEGRPYAGLVGEWIRSPSGRSFVQVGAEKANDPYRFAVFLPEQVDPRDPSGIPVMQDTTAELFPTLQQPRLAVTRRGEIQLHGNTTIEGDLTMDGGGIEFGVGLAFSQGRPWNIYHVTAQEEPGKEHTRILNQLRIEMNSGALATGKNQVVIGAWSAKENRFKPCLTIADNCTVTVHGNLNVEGKFIENAVSGTSATPSLSEGARANKTGMVMASLVNLLSEASKSDRLKHSQTPGITPLPPRMMVTRSAVAPAGPVTPTGVVTPSAAARRTALVRRSVDLLRGSPAVTDAFLAELLSDGTMRERVQRLLGEGGAPEATAPAAEPPAPAAHTAEAVVVAEAPAAAEAAAAEPPAPEAPAVETPPAESPAAEPPAAEPPAAEPPAAQPPPAAEPPEAEPPAGEEPPAAEPPPAANRRSRRKRGGGQRGRTPGETPGEAPGGG